MYIKLSRTKKSESGCFFKKDSILEILSSYKNGDYDVIAIKAVDEENLPYDGDQEVYSMKLDKADFVEVKESDFTLDSIYSAYPGSVIEEDDDNILPQLAAMYDEKDYSVDNDGLVTKRSGLNKEAEGETNKLVDGADKISQDDSLAVDGQDDPGISDPYVENTAEKPSTELWPNPLAKKIQYKIKSLKKRLAEANNISDKDKISQDDNMAIEGSDTIKKDTYKADESVKEWNDKFLGNTN